MFDWIHRKLDQAAVIGKAAVTYLVAAQAVAQVALVQFADIPVVAQYGAQAVAFIGGVILIIRRVTPVAKDERGVLPVE